MVLGTLQIKYVGESIPKGLQFKQRRQKEDERGKLNSNAAGQPGEFPAFLTTSTSCTDTKVKCTTTVIFLNTFGMTKSLNTCKGGYR